MLAALLLRPLLLAVLLATLALLLRCMLLALILGSRPLLLRSLPLGLWLEVVLRRRHGADAVGRLAALRLAIVLSRHRCAREAEERWQAHTAKTVSSGWSTLAMPSTHWF